jgi:Fic family protein
MANAISNGTSASTAGSRSIETSTQQYSWATGDPPTANNQPNEWPTVTVESRDWSPRTNYAVPPGQRRLFGPYEAAVVKPIADLLDVPLSPQARSLAVAASTEIARFDAEVGADIAPFAAILLRSESVASSRIENLTASAKAIALAEVGDTSRENASVIVANTTAMRAAIALSDRLDGAAILAMHDALLRPTHPEWAGRWRTEQVWIGGGDYSPHGAAFVPPHHERVEHAITDLTRFMARVDLPPLVQAAIAHAQFETIHPFPDGNGRTGRALVHSLLRGKSLTRKVTVPVSAGLLSHTDAYFDALTSYRRGDPEQIVVMMSNASYAAVNNGRQLVADLHGVRDSWHERINARRGSAPVRTADLLLSQPVVDSPMLQRELNVSDTVALEAIKRLEGAGVLAKVSGKARYRRYAATEILAQLDAFAARAGRRGGL